MALDASDLLVVQSNDNGALYSLKVSDLPQPDATENATETDAGIVRLATEAEALAGVNDTAVITPAKLEARIDAIPEVEITEIDGGTYA